MSEDHYLPKFYLRRWRGGDGRLCQFSKPYDKIVARRIFPKQTAKQDDLYGPFEPAVMRQIDTEANHALDLLEAGSNEIRTSSRYRSAWATFLMSLMMRMPEHLQTLANAHSNDMATAGIPWEPEKSLELAIGLMKHPGIGQLLVEMRWRVHELSETAGEFLTSDRPLIMLSGLGSLADKDSFIMLPIGPQLLFAATYDDVTQARIAAFPSSDRQRSTNQWVSERAQKFVYGRNDALLGFVDSRYAKKPQKSAFELMNEFRSRI